MAIAKLTNILSQSELDFFDQKIKDSYIPIIDGKYISFEDNDGTGICEQLGRLQISDLTGNMPSSIRTKLVSIARDISGLPLDLTHGVYSIYSNKYGSPQLPPHFDGDTNDLIINFQLESNTSWDIGVGLEVCSLEDNSAAIFNGNTNPHWRPHKSFKDNEYIKMIFFRFHNRENLSDYTKLNYSPGDDVFKEIRILRDNLL